MLRLREEISASLNDTCSLSIAASARRALSEATSRRAERMFCSSFSKSTGFNRNSLAPRCIARITDSVLPLPVIKITLLTRSAAPGAAFMLSNISRPLRPGIIKSLSTMAISRSARYLLRASSPLLASSVVNPSCSTNSPNSSRMSISSSTISAFKRHSPNSV